MIRDNGINYMESLSSIELNNIFNNKYRGNTPLVLYANGGSWNKLSMRERYNYIHNNYDILANGGTLDDIKKKFAEGGTEETVERVLPEVVKRPSEEDRLSLAKIKQMLPDAESRSDMYYELDPFRHLADEPIKISQNESIDRLYDVYKQSGYPKVSNHRTIFDYLTYPFSKDLNRSSYDPITNTMHLPSSEGSEGAKYDAEGFIPELAHAYQFHGNNADFWGNLFHIPGDIKIGGKSGYERSGHMEHTAHSIIEPAILDYVRGETGFFNPITHSEGGPIVQAANGYSSGGKIHIKPENRGKFTALKKRTGHSASWFKAHGTPAQRKMATFALNARKWKHGDGGNLFLDGGTQVADNTRVDLGIIPNLPMDNSLDSTIKRIDAFDKAVTDEEKYSLPYPTNITPETKFYMDLALIGAKDEAERQEILRRYYSTPTIGPTNIAAQTGHMQVNPKTGDVIGYKAPTVKVNNLPGAWQQMAERAWNSPVFQLALAPMFDAPFILGNIAKERNVLRNIRQAFPIHSEELLYRNYINGYSPEKLLGVDNNIFNSLVTKGVLPEVKDNIMHNVVERNLREYMPAIPIEDLDFAANGYRTFANKLLDDVHVGRYSGDNYAKAGERAAGFYIDDADRPFISVNRNASNTLGPLGIEEHEARHLIDYKGLTISPQQEHILDLAYGDDFINLPNTPQGEGFKDYTLMNKEKITTNADSRNVLLYTEDGKLLNAPIEVQNNYIDNSPDIAVFQAIEQSNGYGQAYIEYLRKNNLLTSEKAQAFRESMKRVGGYIPWTIGGGAVGYGYLNQDEGPLVEYAMGGNLFDNGGYSNISFVPHDYTREEDYVEIRPTIPESYEEAERQAREGVKKATREHTLDDFYDNMREFGLVRGLSPRDTLFKGLENNEDNYILINNPESKKTHLRIIPKEVLDSLAYHHGLNPGVPMEVVYGLPEREDEFGGLSLMNIKDRDSLAVLPPFYMFDAWDYMTSPEEDILLAAKRKVLGRPVARNEQLTEKQEQLVQDIIADTYRRDKKTYDKNHLYDPNMNIYDWTWEWFRQGKYNPGDPDYQNKVYKDGLDIINSKAFQEWWEREGKYYYNKGKAEEPKGHRRAYE